MGILEGFLPVLDGVGQVLAPYVISGFFIFFLTRFRIKKWIKESKQ